MRIKWKCVTRIIIHIHVRIHSDCLAQKIYPCVYKSLHIGMEMFVTDLQPWKPLIMSDSLQRYKLTRRELFNHWTKQQFSVFLCFSSWFIIVKTCKGMIRSMFNTSVIKATEYFGEWPGSVKLCGKGNLIHLNMQCYLSFLPMFLKLLPIHVLVIQHWYKSLKV